MKQYYFRTKHYLQSVQGKGDNAEPGMQGLHTRRSCLVVKFKNDINSQNPSRKSYDMQDEVNPSSRPPFSTDRLVCHDSCFI